MIARYEEEKLLLERSMSDNVEYKNLTPKDIANLEKDLYDLELTGEQIKTNVEMSTVSNKNAYSYAEAPLPIKRQPSLDSSSDIKD